MLTDSCLEWEELPKRGFPVLFQSVIGKDTREGKNPSFFNPEEANVVVEYLQKLLDNKQRGMQKVFDFFSNIFVNLLEHAF